MLLNETNLGIHLLKAQGIDWQAEEPGDEERDREKHRRRQRQAREKEKTGTEGGM